MISNNPKHTISKIICSLLRQKQKRLNKSLQSLFFIWINYHFFRKLTIFKENVLENNHTYPFNYIEKRLVKGVVIRGDCLFYVLLFHKRKPNIFDQGIIISVG